MIRTKTLDCPLLLFLAATVFQRVDGADDLGSKQRLGGGSKGIDGSERAKRIGNPKLLAAMGAPFQGVPLVIARPTRASPTADLSKPFRDEDVTRRSRVPARGPKLSYASSGNRARGRGYRTNRWTRCARDVCILRTATRRRITTVSSGKSIVRERGQNKTRLRLTVSSNPTQRNETWSSTLVIRGPTGIS